MAYIKAQVLRVTLALASIGFSTCFANDVLEFPKVGPIVRDITQNQAMIMGQGDRHHDIQGIYRFAKYLDSIHIGPFSEARTFEMSNEDRRVGRAILDQLESGVKYKVQIGYIAQGANIHEANWAHAHELNMMTQPQQKADTFSILAGSCRRLAQILGVPWWDAEGDKIFQAMDKDIQITYAGGGKTDLIAFIGDQIYADATPLDKCKTFEEYAERYELAFSRHFIRSLMATGVPVYMIRDDHEWWNDANEEEQETRPEQNEAAKRAYDIFERPLGKDTPHWWYTVNGNIDMFFLDTRSERRPSIGQIISQEQMNALKAWLIKEDLKDRLKIIVSSVPMFLLDTEDSWGGYKKQLSELLTHITANKIEGVIVLSGDAHCENDALFTILDESGQPKGKILEILVSGLFAVSRNKAGLLSNHMNLKEYGFYATAEEGIKETLKENLFARITGNHAQKSVDVWVYDHKNNKLKESHYDLKTHEAFHVDGEQ